MKGIVKGVAALALALSLGASTAQAQAQFLIGGGSTIALGDFADVANNGPHLIAGVEFTPATFPVGIRVDGMFHSISNEEGDFDGDGDDDETNTRIINGTVNAVYKFKSSPESMFRPYLIAGIGLYSSKPTGDLFEDVDVESESDFGFNAGAGFDFDVGGLALFLEGRFHSVQSDPNSANFIPISLGVKIGG